MYQRFVVVGDSCAEGLDDPYPGSEMFRGWADFVAGRLSELRPGVQYANLAVRGKRLDQIAAEQIPPAGRLNPDLVALFGGVNDLLARGGTPAVLHHRMDTAVAELTATGATVVLFTVGDISRQSLLLRGLRGRIADLNAAVRAAAVRHTAVLVDLENREQTTDLRYFGADRLHLAEHGHRRVAAHVLDALGIAADPAWTRALPGEPMTPNLRSHARWLWDQALPAVYSRARNVIVGRSPGDGFAAKRPQLLPIASAASERP